MSCDIMLSIAGGKIEGKKEWLPLALIECKDCHKQVSTSAISCPHCGCPLKEQVEKPKCPTCGSVNIEKISLGGKVGSAALFGVFAIGHISKTFKCKNCGHKW